MNIDFSLSTLLSGFIFGVFGLYVFRQGRKKENSKLVFLGLAMMLYTYFTKGPLQDWGIGIVLVAAAYHFWHEI